MKQLTDNQRLDELFKSINDDLSDNTPTTFEEKPISYVIVSVKCSDPTETVERLRLVSKVLLRNQLNILFVFPSLILASPMRIRDESSVDEERRLLTFIQEIADHTSSGIKGVYGKVQAPFGGFEIGPVMFFGPILPGLEDRIAVLSKLPAGKFQRVD